MSCWYGDLQRQCSVYGHGSSEPPNASPIAICFLGMESYKRGSHTVWDCKCHIVWVTKYRFPILGGDVGQRCRELLRETARAHEMVVHAGSINRDHVHLLLSIPPSLSVSRAVQYLKGLVGRRT